MAVSGPGWCAACYRPRRGGEYSCPRCDHDVYTRQIPAGVRVEAPHASGEHWTGGLLQGLTRLPPGEVGILSGGPGSGKTTSALTAFPDPQVLSLEVSGTLAAAYCTRLGVRHGGIYDLTAEVAAWHLDPEMPLDQVLRLEELEPGGYALLDSLGVFRQRAGEVFALFQAWCSRTATRGLAIQHATKGGDVAGAQAVMHAGEVTIWCEERRDGRISAKTLKSRWAPTSSIVFDLSTGGERFDLRREHTRRAFCSVEGPIGGPYELAPWPPLDNRKPRWAGAWQTAGELWKADPGAFPLTPPAACACIRSPLYPGGLLDAPDVESRAKHAVEAGLEFHASSDLEATFTTRRHQMRMERENR